VEAATFTAAFSEEGACSGERELFTAEILLLALPAFVLVTLLNPASTPTSRRITVRIESDNLPVTFPMIFFIADRSKYALLICFQFRA
jgi:hypothetical protein